MLDKVLSKFPPHTHPLTLAYDPDGVLADTSLRSVLQARGFHLLQEADPVALRYHAQRSLPFTADRPLVIITPEPLNTLPYDLWKQGYHVELALHKLFPNLSYPVLRTLTSNQLRRLSQTQQNDSSPANPLSYNDTIAYLLETVFDLSSRQVSQSRLISWLDDYHAANDPMAPLLANYLLNQLQRNPHLATWPLQDMLADKDVFRHFVQGSWAAYLRAQGNRIDEPAATYTVSRPLPFNSDLSLQDLLPRLVRTGTLTPLKVAQPSGIPDWARWAIAETPEDSAVGRFAEGLLRLDHTLRESALDWRDWQAIARAWAELSTLRHDRDLHHKRDQLLHYTDLQNLLDTKFGAWLETNYTPHATHILPEPHHLFHVPTWLEYKKELDNQKRLALVILDGMSLAAWLQIRSTLQARRPEWVFDEKLLLAQLPTITAISRQALVSGRPPAQFTDFGGSIKDGKREESGWVDFWTARDLPANSVAYAKISDSLGQPYPSVIDSQRTQVLCLINTSIDEMVHGAHTLSDLHSNLRNWLKPDTLEGRESLWLAGLLDTLLACDYMVTLTSDHGHVEAIGMGQPQEGVVADTRSKRARLYGDGPTAENVQSLYPDTVLWHNDSVLPADTWVLMPKGRKAFVQAGKKVVSHGGLSIEEMIVPLVTITKEQSV